MDVLLADPLDCYASDRVLIATDLCVWQPPLKRLRTVKFSSENEGGVDDLPSDLRDDFKFIIDGLCNKLRLLSSENEGGVDDSRSNDDGWMPDDSHESGQLALFPMEVEPPFSGKSSSENEGRLDDRRSTDHVWMTDEAGLLCPLPPHSLSLSRDLRLGTYDSQVSVQYWNKLESNGSLDREDNHDNRASSENEDRLLGCRSYDDLPLKLTLPVSSTEIGKESHEINGIEGFRAFEFLPSKRRKTEELIDFLFASPGDESRPHRPVLIPEPWFAVGSELERPSSGKSYSENEGRLDDRRSNGDIWMTNKAGLLSPPPPHSLSLDDRLGTCDSQISIQNWNKSESNGSLDREDNHDNRASLGNEYRLLGCRSYDELPLKLTLPVSSTEIGKESNEINGVEGSSEVHPVAGKCPVRHPNAVQLLSASSSNSDCLDDISWMDGRHPSPLVLLMRDRVLKPLHLPHVGTIFGNLKHENVLMTDQLFSTQLSYIQKNNMDLLLAKSTPEAEDLFSHLLKKNPELRPEAGEVLLHPFFWNSKEKLRFLWRISDRLLLKDPAPDPDLLEELESNEPPVFNGNWIDKIDPKFKANILQRGDYYDYSSIMELLRFVRNKYVHFLELPRKIKKLVGWGDESFYNYFAARFPDLLMKSYGAASQFCSEEKWFKEFHRSEISSGVLRK